MQFLNILRETLLQMTEPFFSRHKIIISVGRKLPLEIKTRPFDI